MKRLLIASLTLAFVLGMSGASLAYSVPSLNMNGKNLLVDGDMENVLTTSWTASGSTLTKDMTNPRAGRRLIRVTYASGANFWATQTILTPGKTYRFTGYMRSDGTRLPYIYIGSLGTLGITGTNSTSWQKFDFVKVVPSGAVFYLGSVATAGYVEFDNVQVAEYTGSITDGEKQRLLDGDMEASGTGAWSAGSGATLSKSSSNPYAGGRVLRVTDNGANTNIYALQTPLTAGKRYRVRGVARTDGVNTRPTVWEASGNVWAGTNSTSWQAFDVVFMATGTNLRLYAADGNTGSYTEWDDVLVTEYVGSTKDVEKQILADGDMEKSGTTDWTMYTGATATKITSPRKSGNLSLKVEATGTGQARYYQAIFTGGLTYRVTGWAYSDGVRVPSVYTGSNQLIWVGTATLGWQRFDVVYTNTSATFSNRMIVGTLSSGSAGDYTAWDDVFVSATGK